MDFFLGVDALQNYFSEILGIGVTVLILPFLVRKYVRKKNRPLTHMFLDRVFSYTKYLIKDYLPDAFLESCELERYSNRKKEYTIFQSFRFTQLDQEAVENHYVQLIERLNNSGSYLGKVQKDFDALESEINSWFMIYGPVMTDEVSKLTHKLLYELRSFKHKYGEYLDLDNEYLISNYADYITTITFELVGIYNYVLLQYPVEEGQ